MESRWYVVLGLLALAAMVAAARVFVAQAAGRPALRWKPRIQDDRALAQTLRKIAKKHHQPAMAAALVRGDAIVARAAVGSLAAGDDRPVRLDSRFHIGSTAKGMTALVVAILVREGKLRYDTPLREALPELPVRDDYRGTTVRDLLLHRAGVMALQEHAQEDQVIMERIWTRLPRDVRDPRSQRLEMARVVLALPPIAPPGTKHVYSNVGYAVLGLIAEAAAGESFESLLSTRIFQPLGMTTARLGGWPASAAEPGQPRGHYVESGELRPQPLDDDYVFPAWMNPAGGVHCSVEDYALYARESLLGLLGRGRLLPPACYEEMHDVQARVKLTDMYAPSLEALRAAYGSALDGQDTTIGYGWVNVATRYGPVSACDGSGGTFFARVVVSPGLEAALVAVTSTGAGSAAIGETIRRVTGLDWD